MASEPLLANPPATDANVEAQYLLDEQPDFAQVISADPESVIAYVEQKGVQELGTFKVQVRDAVHNRSSEKWVSQLAEQPQSQLLSYNTCVLPCIHSLGCHDVKLTDPPVAQLPEDHAHKHGYAGPLVCQL